MNSYNPRNYSIEEKYGVAQGEDWLAVRLAAPFQAGQVVHFSNGMTKSDADGKVIDIRIDWRTGDYEYQVQYDGKNVARWTLCKWLMAS